MSRDSVAVPAMARRNCFVHDLLVFLSQNVSTELDYAILQLMDRLTVNKACIAVDFIFFSEFQFVIVIESK